MQNQAHRQRKKQQADCAQVTSKNHGWLRRFSALGRSSSLQGVLRARRVVNNNKPRRVFVNNIVSN